jgi:hypothetical protein
MSTYAEIYLDQGVSFEFELTATEDDGSPMDLADYTFRGEAKRSYYTTRNVVEFAIDDINKASGTIVVSLTAEITETMKPGRYVYDVLGTDSQGQIIKIISGVLFVSPTATRPESQENNE